MSDRNIYPNNVLADEDGPDSDYMERSRISCYLPEMNISLRLTISEKGATDESTHDGRFRIVRESATDGESADHAYLGHGEWERLGEFFARCATECRTVARIERKAGGDE